MSLGSSLCTAIWSIPASRMPIVYLVNETLELVTYQSTENIINQIQYMRHQDHVVIQGKPTYQMRTACMRFDSGQKTNTKRQYSYRTKAEVCKVTKPDTFCKEQTLRGQMLTA